MVSTEVKANMHSVGRRDVRPSNAPLPRIETESITQKAQRLIGDHVLSGQLKPGTRLVESQLADQLGVSRAPVREALLALEAEGWVASRPNKGTVGSSSRRTICARSIPCAAHWKGSPCAWWPPRSMSMPCAVCPMG